MMTWKEVTPTLTIGSSYSGLSATIRREAKRYTVQVIDTGVVLYVKSRLKTLDAAQAVADTFDDIFTGKVDNAS